MRVVIGTFIVKQCQSVKRPTITTTVSSILRMKSFLREFNDQRLEVKIKIHRRIIFVVLAFTNERKFQSIKLTRTEQGPSVYFLVIKTDVCSFRCHYVTKNGCQTSKDCNYPDQSFPLCKRLVILLSSSFTSMFVVRLPFSAAVIIDHGKLPITRVYSFFNLSLYLLFFFFH